MKIKIFTCEHGNQLFKTDMDDVKSVETFFDPIDGDDKVRIDMKSTEICIFTLVNNRMVIVND